MIRTCTEDDIKYHKTLMPPEAPCGRTYDDAECSTICPHEKLPQKLTEEELQELFDKLNTPEGSS